MALRLRLRAGARCSARGGPPARHPWRANGPALRWPCAPAPSSPRNSPSGARERHAPLWPYPIRPFARRSRAVECSPTCAYENRIRRHWGGLEGGGLHRFARRSSPRIREREAARTIRLPGPPAPRAEPAYAPTMRDFAKRSGAPAAEANASATAGPASGAVIDNRQASSSFAGPLRPRPPASTPSAPRRATTAAARPPPDRGIVAAIGAPDMFGWPVAMGRTGAMNGTTFDARASTGALRDAGAKRRDPLAAAVREAA